MIGAADKFRRRNDPTQSRESPIRESSKSTSRSICCKSFQGRTYSGAFDFVTGSANDYTDAYSRPSNGEHRLKEHGKDIQVVVDNRYREYAFYEQVRADGSVRLEISCALAVKQ